MMMTDGEKSAFRRALEDQWERSSTDSISAPRVMTDGKMVMVTIAVDQETYEVYNRLYGDHAYPTVESMMASALRKHLMCRGADR